MRNVKLGFLILLTSVLLFDNISEYIFSVGWGGPYTNLMLAVPKLTEMKDVDSVAAEL